MFLTIMETASFLRVSRNTVKRLLRDGAIASFRVDERNVRVHANSLADYCGLEPSVVIAAVNESSNKKTEKVLL